MAGWELKEQPTGDFKFEAEQYSPNGKLFTLKGIRAMYMPDDPNKTGDPSVIRQGLGAFFKVFGLTIPTSVQTDGGTLGVLNAKRDLNYNRDS